MKITLNSITFALFVQKLWTTLSRAFQQYQKQSGGGGHGLEGFWHDNIQEKQTNKHMPILMYRLLKPHHFLYHKFHKLDEQYCKWIREIEKWWRSTAN